MDAALIVDSVTITYPRTTAPVVQDISFSTPRGASFGLVGESGSGKTTLARAVVGLLRPTSGQIRFPGAERGRRPVQMVFQDPGSSLNPRLTVGESIAEVLRTTPHRRRDLVSRIADQLIMVGLDPAHANRFPRQLSGGQRQRVAITRALAAQPKVLVLDEVVSALDVSVQAQVLNLLKRLQAEQQLTYLFITHDLAVVRYMCDEVMVMNRGRVVESLAATTIFSRAEDSYTRELISAIPELRIGRAGA
ncbi:ATP-binding cassette domain-containing protein [Naumannella huperziae]